ncbi:hypothetical protein GPECTOR_288g771 [Gonium pectorale]|uniref:Protein kinase domain-containing protein n=1 Tax=Gonium pectorale TaxID=33097 RepID=A0A150FVX2_GONPE|nr:hypothetical protein GPECTOR_288g771 [Gonium pectorale]|eukprot:KXZ41772.1 hypothetical protein GPECTOR_288g771 [Gonium pectorale]
MDSTGDLPTANLYRVAPTGSSAAAGGGGRSRSPRHAAAGHAPSPLGHGSGHGVGTSGPSSSVPGGQGAALISRSYGAPELMSSGIGSDTALALAAGLIIGGPHLGSTGSLHNTGQHDHLAVHPQLITDGEGAVDGEPHDTTGGGASGMDAGGAGFTTLLSGRYSFDGGMSLLSGPSNIYSFDDNPAAARGAGGQDGEGISRTGNAMAMFSGADLMGGSRGERGPGRAGRAQRTAERREFLSAAKCINAVLQDVQIVSVLGAGAHGRVYKGAFKDRFVAVKVIRHDADSVTGPMMPGGHSVGGSMLVDPPGPTVSAATGSVPMSGCSPAASRTLPQPSSAAAAYDPSGSGTSGGQLPDASTFFGSLPNQGMLAAGVAAGAAMAVGSTNGSRPAAHMLRYQRAGSSNMHALPLSLPGSTEGGSRAGAAGELPVLSLPGMPPVVMPHKTMLEGLISASAQHPNIVETYRIVTQLLSSPGMPAFIVTRGSQQAPLWETTNLPAAAFLGIANASMGGIASPLGGGMPPSPHLSGAFGGLPTGNSGLRSGGANQLLLAGRSSMTPRLQRASSLGPSRDGNARAPLSVSPLGLAGYSVGPDADRMRRSGSSQVIAGGGGVGGVWGGGGGTPGSSDPSGGSFGAKAMGSLLGQLFMRNTNTATTLQGVGTARPGGEAPRVPSGALECSQSKGGSPRAASVVVDAVAFSSTMLESAEASSRAHGSGQAGITCDACAFEADAAASSSFFAGADRPTAGASEPHDNVTRVGSSSEHQSTGYGGGGAGGGGSARRRQRLGDMDPRMQEYMLAGPGPGPAGQAHMEPGPEREPERDSRSSGPVVIKQLAVVVTDANAHASGEGGPSAMYEECSSTACGCTTPDRGSTANSAATGLSPGPAVAAAAAQAGSTGLPLPLREGSTLSVSALVQRASSSGFTSNPPICSTVSDEAASLRASATGFSGSFPAADAAAAPLPPPLQDAALAAARPGTPVSAIPDVGVLEDRTVAEIGPEGQGGPAHKQEADTADVPSGSGEPAALLGARVSAVVVQDVAIASEQDSAEIILDLLGQQAAAQRSHSFLMRHRQMQQQHQNQCGAAAVPPSQAVAQLALSGDPDAAAAAAGVVRPDGAAHELPQSLITPPVVPPTPRTAGGPPWWGARAGPPGPLGRGAPQAAVGVEDPDAVSPRAGELPGSVHSPAAPSSFEAGFPEAAAPFDYMVADEMMPHTDPYGLTTALFSSHRTETGSMPSRPLSGVALYGPPHQGPPAPQAQAQAGSTSTGASASSGSASSKGPSPHASPFVLPLGLPPPVLPAAHVLLARSQKSDSTASNASVQGPEPSLALPAPLPQLHAQPTVSAQGLHGLHGTGSSLWLPTIDELTAGVSALPPSLANAAPGPARSSGGSAARHSLQRTASAGWDGTQPAQSPVVGNTGTTGTGTVGRTSTASGASLPSGGNLAGNRSTLSSNGAGGQLLPADLHYDKLSWSNYTHTSASTNAMLNSGFTALLASINTAGGSAGGPAGPGPGGLQGAGSLRTADSTGAAPQTAGSRRTINTVANTTVTNAPSDADGPALGTPPGSDALQPTNFALARRTAGDPDLRTMLAGPMSRSFTDARSSRSSWNARRRLVATSRAGAAAKVAGTGAPSSLLDPGPGRERWQVLIVQELCSKGNLRDAIANGTFHSSNTAAGTQVIAMRQLLDTASEIASAMAYLHSRAIVHGDLKSANVLLQRNDTDPRGFVSKLADFGLARQLGKHGVEDGLLVSRIGTVTHMAPETIQDNMVVLGSDVYSFGVIMWELYCAQQPFANYTAFQLLSAVVQYDERPQFPSHCPPAYAALAVRCMAKSPRDRPTFPEVHTELVRIRDTLFGDGSHGTISVPLTQARKEATRVLQSHLHIVSGSVTGGPGGITSGNLRDQATQESNFTSSLESWDVYSRSTRRPAVEPASLQ